MILEMKNIIYLLVATVFFASCDTFKKVKSSSAETGYSKNFEVAAEEFGDLQTLRYEIPGFTELTTKQKELCYYLYEAALCGRDMIYDQKGKYGIYMRKILENMYTTYKGNKTSEEWKQFQEYCGRFWFSSGNHHHYGNEKFIPACSWAYFLSVYQNSDAAGFPSLGLEKNEMAFIQKTFYDLNFQPKCVDLRSGIDNVSASSNNFYENISMKEVEDYYAKKPTSGNAPSWGLNSKTMKEYGKVVEKIWKSGGMYGSAIDKICYWLDKAIAVAENDNQKKALSLLAKYYRSGDLKDFDDYSIAWVKDIDSRVDVVNGFIEVYLDAIGKKGSFESTVSIRDEETTKKIKTIAENAQWFEDNSPLDPMHKKKVVKGITAKAITVVVESGDAAPSTPIGINLPNADWIRKDHGSKSVSLSNIVHSYNVQSAKKGTLDEFGLNDEVKNRLKEYGALASDLHTDMHECIGHASGQINEGVETTDKTLKNYASCLEEARADLVGLYYLMDKKLIDIGVMPNMDVAKAGYDNYMMNGLMTQLTRLKLGDEIEEAHMRNRQLNARWVYEMGRKENVVSFENIGGKTFVKINDYHKLRVLFGQLLKEIQRIKSEGDFAAGQSLVENYGVKVDLELHKEILQRFEKLGLKPYRGFIQPKLIPVIANGKITDVQVIYPTSFYAQMLEYGKNYGFLPVQN
jgi:dipeptidyl-peptidase III